VALVVLVAVGVMGMRLRGWHQEEQKLLQDGTRVMIRVKFWQPIDTSEQGCVLEWRGWRLYFYQSICDSSKLMTLSAGDIIDLELLNYDSRKEQHSLLVRQVKILEIRQPARWSAGWWQNQLYLGRMSLVKKLKQLLPAREAGLVAGILLGVKTELPEEFYQALVKTGTMHVVAASGYNITVVVGVVMQLLLSRWRRGLAATMAIPVVWIYVLLAGAGPPIIRAGVMNTMVLFAWIMGREYWVLYGFLLSGWLMVVVSPWLLMNISFQLSMAATVGVVWGTAVLEQWTRSISELIKDNFWLNQGWESLKTTIAAMMWVAPLSCMYFGSVSLWGLVANPLVLGLVPILMYLGLGLSFLGYIWWSLAQLVGWLTLPLAKMWIEVVMRVGGWPGGMVELTVNWWMVVGWWLICLGVMRWSCGRQTHD
jgi:ComEC/Rec2-related protein